MASRNSGVFAVNAIVCTGMVALWSMGANAEIPEHALAVTERQFVPSEVVIPADLRVRLMIRNDDSLPVEFESADLSREVIVPPHRSVPVYVGPLSPGTYEFFDDFNPDARGRIRVDAVQEEK